MPDILDNLTRRELRHHALDRGILGARWMSKGNLLKRLRGKWPALYNYLYILPIEVVWQLGVLVVLVFTQFVLLISQSLYWIGKRFKTQSLSMSETDTLAQSPISKRKSQSTIKASSSITLVRVREILIREVTLVRVSEDSEDDDA